MKFINWAIDELNLSQSVVLFILLLAFLFALFLAGVVVGACL